MKIVQTVADIGHNSAGPSYSVPNLCRGLNLAGCEAELVTRENALWMMPMVYPGWVRKTKAAYEWLLNGGKRPKWVKEG